jgi:GTP:adenosylcobinamide-phosphate guanylyltransferase
MDALVIAGGTAEPGLQQRGVQRVPLLKVGGETLAARTCRLLAEAGCDSVYLLAPEEVPLPSLPQTMRCAYGTDLLADITACVKSMHGDGLLVATGDMPLLGAEAIRGLIDFVHETGAQVVYPVVEKAVMEQRGLGEGRTYKKVGGKNYTGGNLFYIDREWLVSQESLLRGLFEQRKDPMALAKFFGAGFVWKVVSGSLTLPYAEEYLSKRLGARIRVLVSPYPEIAADLDKASDLQTFADVLDPGQLSGG